MAQLHHPAIVPVHEVGQQAGVPYLVNSFGQGMTLEDVLSDVYRLGVVLYEMLTGELPFRGNARMLLHQVLHEDPRSPRSLNHLIPRDLETICLRCLQKDPSQRYANSRVLLLQRRGACPVARDCGHP